MTIKYLDSKRIVALSTDEAPTPDLTYDDFPTSYSGWTKSSNDATKLAFSSNRANFSIGETYVDARAYGYDIGFDLDGDYCIDFDFTFTNTPFTSAGQAVAFTFGISTTTADVSGEDPTMNSEQTKMSGYPSGSYTYIYARAKSSAGTNASGNESNTAFPLNSSATQLRYGRLSRSGTTFKVQFFSDSTRETEVANYSVTTTAQTVRYLYLKSYSQNSGQAWAGYLDNIKIYKDQSSPIPVKPTNVQDNSILVEKDTGRRYWFSKAPEATDDYTSNKGYVDNTSDWAVPASGKIDFETIRRSTTSQEMYIDLQDSDYLGENLSDTNWTVRFGKFKVVNEGTQSGNVLLHICLSNTNGSSGGTQQTHSCQVNFSQSAGGYTNYCTTGNLHGSGASQQNVTGTAGMADGDERYIEMSRSGNDFTVKICSDSDYQTVLGSGTQTKTGISGLQYLKFVNDSEQNASLTASAELFGGLEIINGADTWTYKAKAKTPAQIGNLKVHYDATVGVTASSNSVSAWADQSGNGKTLSSVSNPTRVVAGLNGKDYLDFNSAKSMRATGLSETAPRPFTMVAVINPRNGGSQAIIRWSQNQYLALYQNPANTYYMSGGTELNLTDSTLDGSWNTFFMDFKSNADGGTLQINLDTANAVSGTLGTNGTSGTTATLHVGINADNNNWQGSCRYAEIIIFDNVLTAFEKADLYEHLKTKWGLP